MIDHQDILVDECCKLFSEQKKTVAFAEGATAGWLSYKFSMSPHAGNVLKGGIVCYDPEVKKQLLQVPASVIKKFTSESPEVTRMIAEGMKESIEADYYVGITGLLKRGGSENIQKPVGTIYTSIIGPEGAELSDRELFKGNEEDILKGVLENVCSLLVYLLRENRSLKIFYLFILCNFH